MKLFITLISIVLLASCAFAATLSGANVPYDSSFHLGLVSGLGSGVNLGADVYFPLESFSLGGGFEQQITNTDFNQNINMFRYHLGVKYSINENIFLTFSLGRGSFYLEKAYTYTDSLTGEKYTLDEATNNSVSYYSIAPNFFINDYILTPKLVVNNIEDGGTLYEINLNLGHNF
jgi:hypothetical protein